jgi:hypothetical protein
VMLIVRRTSHVVAEALLNTSAKIHEGHVVSSGAPDPFEQSALNNWNSEFLPPFPADILVWIAHASFS